MSNKERPILFSGEMVKAILDGRKTQTRRICKGPKKLRNAPEGSRFYTVVGRNAAGELDNDVARVMPDWAMESLLTECPYGQPGDRLWVRESFALVNPLSGCDKNCRPDHDHGVRYAATWTKSHSTEWKPSIHIPRWASRINLEITGVRVERLQEISEADAMSEGIQLLNGRYTFNGGLWEERTARDAFKALWHKINGEVSWFANPWVWVVEFRSLA